MASFKLLRGTSEGLKNLPATEGYAYFTPDDGKFYIDTNTTTTAEEVRVGNDIDEIVDGLPVNRVCINQKVFNYNDYDILDCGTSTSVTDDTFTIFDCNG